MIVSIIIPTYRRAGALLNCIDSLLAGARLPEEIVVVGRAGDSETEEAIVGIRERCEPSVRLTTAWVDVPGHIPPVQKGAQVAAGELVALVDDDVTMVPEWLETLAAHFEDPTVGVTGGRVLVPGAPLPKTKGKPGRISWYGKAWGNIGAWEGPSGADVDAVMEGNSMWRRKLLSELEFDPVLNFEDGIMYGLDLCLQAKKRGARVVFEPRALVYHHVAPRPPEVDRHREDRWFAYCRNYTYVLLKELPPWRRPIFLVWWFGVGERGAWGAGSLLADAILSGLGKPRFVAQTLRGKMEGIRLWSKKRHPPAK